MHLVLVNRVGGLSLPGNSVVRLTGRSDMTIAGHCGRKTTSQKFYFHTLKGTIMQARIIIFCKQVGDDLLYRGIEN